MPTTTKVSAATTHEYESAGRTTRRCRKTSTATHKTMQIQDFPAIAAPAAPTNVPKSRNNPRLMASLPLRVVCKPVTTQIVTTPQPATSVPTARSANPHNATNAVKSNTSSHTGTTGSSAVRTPDVDAQQWLRPLAASRRKPGAVKAKPAPMAVTACTASANPCNPGKVRVRGSARPSTVVSRAAATPLRRGGLCCKLLGSF
mmetsp:Transcript_15084/g.52951  ORF Transcript_15084/g.52951 Transcript_15084/m.52951 type:complete len:202 (-) Transcript_15084:12-617(-)